MPEHRWSLLCRHAVVDKYTNQLSILDVLDEGEAGQVPREVDPGEIAITLNAQLVSVWARSDPNTPETFWQTVTITAPDGTTHDAAARLEGNLRNHQRTRLIVGVKAIPFRGLGTYTFDIHTSHDEGAPGERVARVPLELKAHADEPASAT